MKYEYTVEYKNKLKQTNEILKTCKDILNFCEANSYNELTIEGSLSINACVPGNSQPSKKWIIKS